jgi:hypothetical protein
MLDPQPLHIPGDHAEPLGVPSCTGNMLGVAKLDHECACSGFHDGDFALPTIDTQIAGV